DTIHFTAILTVALIIKLHRQPFAIRALFKCPNEITIYTVLNITMSNAIALSIRPLASFFCAYLHAAIFINSGCFIVIIFTVFVVSHYVRNIILDTHISTGLVFCQGGVKGFTLVDIFSAITIWNALQLIL